MPANFTPPSILKNGHIQSIATLFWPQPRSVPGNKSRHLVPIEHCGTLSIVENRPDSWQPGGRIVLLVHGLTGSEDSTHSVRLARGFLNRGIMAIRMNLRGCGPGAGLASGIYHSGRSEDTTAVIEWIGLKFPGSPVTQIGVSLGGNVTLKMAGEYGDHIPAHLDSVVSVSAPIALDDCSRRLSHWSNRHFDRYFSGRMVQHIDTLSRRFPDRVRPMPKMTDSNELTLAKIDDIYVGPESGFRDGQHYYQECSSALKIPSIKCRTLLLTSDDDPIISADAYKRLKLSSHHNLVITKHGGHAAWIGQNKLDEFGRFWMDRYVVNWVTSLAH
jgi:uncharacterized protein